jgi:hypothetical protein
MKEAMSGSRRSDLSPRAECRQGSCLPSVLRRERRDFSISIAATGGFMLMYRLALDVGIHDRVPSFTAGSCVGFRGTAFGELLSPERAVLGRYPGFDSGRLCFVAAHNGQVRRLRNATAADEKFRQRIGR